MSKKAHALGIPEKHLVRALKLVRDLRATALADGLDPRATRIALIYANKCDQHFAAKRLTFQDLVKLEEIAHSFFIQQLRKWKAL